MTVQMLVNKTKNRPNQIKVSNLHVSSAHVRYRLMASVMTFKCGGKWPVVNVLKLYCETR